jgi:hypothetical protein
LGEQQEGHLGNSITRVVEDYIEGKIDEMEWNKSDKIESKEGWVLDPSVEVGATTNECS